MCRPVECEKCQKVTWTGCGLHIDQVKEHVLDDLWCSCPRPDAH